MNIAVVSFENKQVDQGIKELIDLYQDKELRFFLPITHEDQIFIQSVLKVCIDKKIKVTAFLAHAAGMEAIVQQVDDVVVSDNPVKDVIQRLGAGDAIGIVWDNSPQAHFVLNSVEDLALDTWDITNGIDEIVVDEDMDYMASDELHDLLHNSLGMFVDALAAFVGQVVMESLTEAVIERLKEEEDKRDISPFDDNE